MKCLTALTIAAALMLTAPAWAQAPTAASASPPTAAPKARQMHHHVVHRRGRHYVVHHRGMDAGDAMTAQLNREELARIQGAAMPMPMQEHGPGGAGQGGPRASGHSGMIP